MYLTEVHALACTAMAVANGSAQVNDGRLAPLQVPAKTLPVPTDVSLEMQRIIAAPRNPESNVLWKTGEEWRAAANERAPSRPVPQCVNACTSRCSLRR
jgi:hypothetical protein